MHITLATPDLAMFIVRITVGLFFALSGFNKLFNKGRHATFVATLKEDKIPHVSFMQWWVPGWEFLGGLMVTAGFLTFMGAGALAVIMCVACYSEAALRVKSFAPINKADVLDDYLYLPEVLYLVMLLAVLSAGPGSYSVDHLIWG